MVSFESYLSEAHPLRKWILDERPFSDNPYGSSSGISSSKEQPVRGDREYEWRRHRLVYYFDHDESYVEIVLEKCEYDPPHLNFHIYDDTTGYEEDFTDDQIYADGEYDEFIQWLRHLDSKATTHSGGRRFHVYSVPTKEQFEQLVDSQQLRVVNP